MAEKGGKKFTVPSEKKTAKKSTTKKQASLEGKDGYTTKSVRKGFVDSDSEDSVEEMPNLSSKTPSKSGGKVSFEAPSFKDLGKGGKTDGMGKFGVKSSTSASAKVTTEKVELKIEDELPKNARCLMDCEAADVLQGIQEQLSMLYNDPTIKVPEYFSKGLQYAQSGTTYKSSQTVRQALEKLKRSKVSEGEICIIANVCPETVDEVFALLPSLEATKVHNEGPIRDALAELAALKQSSKTY
ncbi:DNA-directed RNA polymerase II subunit 4-like [Aristolochia californica]|uniref:DNA-directed RNA polymerase II subunit 4-like n=1 Tax=Aristolochia californica TaxID=171875 RepID=UPI0035E2204D